MNRSVDFEDIQGLVRFGYGGLKAARYLLMRVVDAAAARAWLADAPLATAVAGKPPETALQLAFTSAGLLALGVPSTIVEGFSPEFVVGMGTDAARARRLGDVGPNDPSRWRWGIGARLPHVMILLFAHADTLDALCDRIVGECAEGLERIDSLETDDMGDIEPFGFADGLSQPLVDWERERPVADETRLAYGNRVCLGEFVLGYPNEYGGYADRPLIDRALDPAALLPPAEDAPGMADVGRNGSYLAVRQLRQDVRTFWRYFDDQGKGDPGLRMRWAEAAVGRTLDGTPLVGDRHEAIDGLGKSAVHNAFTYRADPEGLRCPLGAHVRRANPRNADLPADTSGLVQRLVRMLGFDAAAREQDKVSSTRFHRLLRRGREYGTKLSIAEALADQPVAKETGLHFLCLGANLARQFEFVQNAWLMSAKFDGLHDERDPIVGHRLPGPDGTSTDNFTIPQGDGPSARLCAMPDFVTVVGGAYFFMPGRRALRYLCSHPRPPAETP